MNRLSEEVYKFFTIQVELGEREYSYSQPFFLSKTIFGPDLYPFSTIETILNRHFDLRNQNIRARIRREYNEYGLFVLRATVMNPYIYYIKKKRKINLIQEFVKFLENATNEVLKQI